MLFIRFQFPNFLPFLLKNERFRLHHLFLKLLIIITISIINYLAKLEISWPQWNKLPSGQAWKQSTVSSFCTNTPSQHLSLYCQIGKGHSVTIFIHGQNIVSFWKSHWCNLHWASGAHIYFIPMTSWSI